MKKLLMVLLAVLMAFTLVACGKDNGSNTGDGGDEVEEPTFDASAVDLSTLKLADTKNLVTADSREPSNLDYVTTALAADHQFNVNFVDGLVEEDNHGTYVPCLAESWESNEDASVWTFHLRKGVNWSTNSGEVYAEVTAQDFVTGIRHAAEFQTGTADVLGAIAGFTDYFNNGDYSDEAWAKVGVKALDDYTVEYTLEAPTPYFYTSVEYAPFYPVNQKFLESKGDGCKLGSPDVNTCSFGSLAPDSILYNGGFVLSAFDSHSKTVIAKNQNYWDADNIHVDTVTYIYDDGSDPYSGIRGFEQNTYASSSLPSSNEEVYNALAKKYAGYTTVTLPNYYVFGVVFNYNRVTFDNTGYATDETAKNNTRAAVLNKNFRLALKAAYDVPAYVASTQAPEVAEACIRNINDAYNLVSTTDGKQYGQLVEEAYTELTGETVSLADGQWPWLSKDKALAYLDAAEEELGFEITAENPIHLDMLCIDTSQRLVKSSQSMKQSIEENTDGRIVIDLVLRDSDTVQNIAYYTSAWQDADFDISTFTGWGPDFADPKTFCDIYSPVDGYYMHAVGLTDMASSPDDYGSDDDIKATLGFTEYQKLLDAADAITGDLDARYKAYAKADAYLIANGLYIPTTMSTGDMVVRVSHVVPFTRSYGQGVSQYKWKGLELQEDLVTTEQYEAAKADWEAGK